MTTQTSAASVATRPRVGVVKFASCDGCQLSILDLESELLEVVARFEIVEFPEASSNRSEGPYDVLLVEGSISTEEQAEQILELPAQGVERVPDCHVDVGVGVVLVRLPACHQLAAGHPEVDPDVEVITPAMVLVQRLDGDGATHDAVEELLDLPEVFQHIRLDRGRALHVPERDLRRQLHGRPPIRAGLNSSYPPAGGTG